MRLKEHLQTYSHQPDCFKRAARTIRTRCGELDMCEDERIRGKQLHDRFSIDCTDFVAAQLLLG